MPFVSPLVLPVRDFSSSSALLRARAMENQAVIAASNRFGNDPYHRYMGKPVILSPEGRVLALAGT